MSLGIQKEVLRQEIQKGIDDIRDGRSTTLESADDYEQMAEKIIKRKKTKSFSVFEAKNKLDEIITSAENGEPQIITKNGRKSVVVISYGEFKRLTAQKESLSDFLLNSPLRGSDIDLTPSK